MSLAEGQYQIGNTVFGKGTNITIVSIEAVGYETTPGDQPLPQSDEIRFTRDYIQPGVMQFSLAALENKIIFPVVDSIEESNASVIDGVTVLDNFRADWRGDDVRFQWGATKPLRYCAKGRQRMLYGRPRNIASDRVRNNAGWYGITASYQLADVLSYASLFSAQAFLPTATGVSGGNIYRGNGTAPSWMKLTVIGPISSPVINIGSMVFTIDKTLAAGQALELNSYPWERRAIDSLGNNIGTKLIADSPYLEDMRFPAGEIWPVSLHGGSTTSSTGLVVQWQEAYHAV